MDFETQWGMGGAFDFESGFYLPEKCVLYRSKLFLGKFSFKDLVLYGTFCVEAAPLTLSTA
jgi:hypothetical protein